MSLEASTKFVPTLADLEAARERIAGHVHATPVYASESLSRRTGRPTWLKAENLQRTGSFKIRGAVNKLAGLTDAERAAGVVAASAGNHGQAVARAAREFGIPATVYMPQDAPMAKVEATRNYGGETVLAGAGFDEALAEALMQAEETGATFVHAFEDGAVIAGQGTIGLELADDLPDVETFVLPVGGGGLAAGIAIALRATRPGVRLVGVQAGKSGRGTIADGIAVKHPGELTMSILDDLLDDIVHVEDEEIADAITLLLERAKLVVEGAGAASVAALLNGKVGGSGGRLRAPLRRQHRSDHAHLGDAARAHPRRPLPGRAHANPRPAGLARRAARARRGGAWQRPVGRPPARGHGDPRRGDRHRADDRDAGRAALPAAVRRARPSAATRSTACGSSATRRSGGTRPCRRRSPRCRRA